MKITLIKDFGINKKGTVLDVSSSFAQSLVKKGVAELFKVKPKKEVKETKEK